MRERLVFDGRIQDCGANMNFLSTQPLYIKMTYVCKEHSVGGIKLTHVGQKTAGSFILLLTVIVVFCGNSGVDGTSKLECNS